MSRDALPPEFPKARAWKSAFLGCNPETSAGFDLLEQLNHEASPDDDLKPQPHHRGSLLLRREVEVLLQEDAGNTRNGVPARIFICVLLATFVLISANDPLIKAASKVEINGKRQFAYSPSSVILVSCILTVMLGNGISFFHDGWSGVARCWDRTLILKMSPPAALFTVCAVLKFTALRYLPADIAILLDQSSLVVMAIMISYFMKTSYSPAQWTSLLLITISMLQYMALRDADRRNTEVNLPTEMSSNLLLGLGLMSIEVVFSVISALLAEKLLKEVDAWFWEQKARMELSGSIVAACSCYIVGPLLFHDTTVIEKGLFYGWDRMTLVVLLLTLSKVWLSSLIAKTLNSLVKQIGSCAAVLLVYFEMLILPPPFSSESVEFDYNAFVALIVVAASILSFVTSTREAKLLRLAIEKVEQVRRWASKHKHPEEGGIELQSA